MQPASDSPQRRQAATASRPSSPDLLRTASETELARALVTDDEPRAALAAETLWRSTGSLELVYRVVSEQLASAGTGWATGYTSLAVAQRITVAAERLVARLRPLPAPSNRGTVVLACPPQDAHTLGLDAVAHLVEVQGYRAVLGRSLPWADLAELAAEEDDLVALGLSLHTNVDVRSMRRGLAVLRDACGPVPVLVGGPRVQDDPLMVKRLGADAAPASDEKGLVGLAGLTSRLSERERQVLECVATGMTNAEAGEALGLGTETIKSHLDHVFAKTGTTHRAAAVATALRNGWVS